MRASLPEGPGSALRTGRAPLRPPIGAADARRRQSGTLARIRAGGSSVSARRAAFAPPGRCSTVPPDLTTRFAKSADLHPLADLDVAAQAHPARHDRLLAHDRDARRQPPRLLPVRRVVVGPVADDRRLADHDLLVEDRAVHDRAGPDTVSNMMIESRTTAPTSTRTPGDRTLFTTIPLITQPCEIRLRWTCAVGPDLGRRPLLGPGVDQPVAVVQVELRDVLEERHVGLPVRLDRARRPASSPRTGSRRPGPRPRASPGSRRRPKSLRSSDSQRLSARFENT